MNSDGLKVLRQKYIEDLPDSSHFKFTSILLQSCDFCKSTNFLMALAKVSFDRCFFFSLLLFIIPLEYKEENNLETLKNSISINY